MLFAVTLSLFCMSSVRPFDLLYVQIRRPDFLSTMTRVYVLLPSCNTNDCYDEKIDYVFVFVPHRSF